MSGNSPAPPQGRDKFDAWFDDANAERDRLTERVAELVTEGNELRKLVGEMIYDIPAGLRPKWRGRSGLPLPVTPDGPQPEPAATAGTEHLAAKIRGLAIGDEED